MLFLQATSSPAPGPAPGQRLHRLDQTVMITWPRPRPLQWHAVAVSVPHPPQQHTGVTLGVKQTCRPQPLLVVPQVVDLLVLPPDQTVMTTWLPFLQRNDVKLSPSAVSVPHLRKQLTVVPLGVCLFRLPQQHLVVVPRVVDLVAGPPLVVDVLVVPTLPVNLLAVVPLGVHRGMAPAGLDVLLPLSPRVVLVSRWQHRRARSFLRDQGIRAFKPRLQLGRRGVQLIYRCSSKHMSCCSSSR